MNFEIQFEIEKDTTPIVELAGTWRLDSSPSSGQTAHKPLDFGQTSCTAYRTLLDLATNSYVTMY
jgi:hypothetical protein